jgi:hypothetical protein
MYQGELTMQDKDFFIRAYFEDLEQKFNFLPELAREGHSDEARLLCCCYIDWLGNWMYDPQKGSRRNFVRVLEEYGGEEILLYIHIRQLENALSNSQPDQQILSKISSILDNERDELHTEQELIDLVRGVLTGNELERFKKQLWRGSLASIVYSEMRCPDVHRGAAPTAITFDKTTFRNKPVPALDFVLLHPVLKRILQVAKNESLKSGKWFGHDFSF